MVHTEYDEKENILKTTFEGDVSIKEIVDYINSTKDNSHYPRSLRILTDSSASKMNIDPEEVHLIIEANFQSLEKYDYIIDAIVLENPYDTAISMLYQEFSKTNKYLFKLFATKKAALEWLKKAKVEK